MKYSIAVLFLFAALSGRSQNNVELVISNQFDSFTGACFSHDNKLLAKLIAKTVSVWDVATGRMIRTRIYTDDIAFTADTIWFSDNDEEIIVSHAYTNDEYHIKVINGESNLVTGAPFDYTAITAPTLTGLTKANMAVNDPTVKKFEIPSADGNKKLIIKKIKNRNDATGRNTIIALMILQDAQGGTHKIDSAYYCYYAMSSDSKYLFCNGAFYNMQSGKMVSRTPPYIYSGKGVAFLPGTRIPVTCGSKSLRIWNFPAVTEMPLEYMVDFKVSPDGKLVVAEQVDFENKQKRFSVIDLSKQEVLRSFALKDFDNMIWDVDVDASRIVTFWFKYNAKDPSSYRSEMRVLDGENGDLIKGFKATTRAFFSADPDYILTDSGSLGSYRAHMKSNEFIKFPSQDFKVTTQVRNISIDKKHLLGWDINYADGKVKYELIAWSSTTGEKEFSAESETDGGSPHIFHLCKNHEILAIGYVGTDVIHVYDFKAQKLKFSLKGHTGSILEIAISDDSKRMLSSSMDGTVRLWNLETAKEMVALVSTGEKDWAIVNPQSYYYSTRGAQKYIHFVKGKDIYPFEQFDLKYNRPDIILESLQASNQELIRPFNLAYLKRLKRLGFTEEMLDGEFHLPKVNVTNKDDLPLISSSRDINLVVHGIDSKFKIDRVLIRVNGVPIHGKLGVSVKDKKKNLLKEEYKVRLSTGVNRIAVSIMNEKGVESIASNVDIEYNNSTVELPELHLVTMGVSKYADPQFDLNYAAKDASDLTNHFVTQHLPFSKVNSYHLENTEVTSAKLQEIKTKLSASSEDDVVCLFFAGHGLLDADLNYFLAAHDVNFQNPAEGGIPYELFEELVDGIPARKKLVMIDACHSGEIDKDEVAWAENTEESNTETNEDIDFRAVTATGFKQVGLENSYELMKELFTDIRKSSGALIISSAGGTEYAMEGSDWNNGVFTYSLLKGMSNGEADLNKDGKVMAGELNEFVRIKVSELTGGRQTPTTRAEVLENDWRMW